MSQILSSPRQRILNEDNKRFESTVKITISVPYKRDTLALIISKYGKLFHFHTFHIARGNRNGMDGTKCIMTMIE